MQKTDSHKWREYMYYEPYTAYIERLFHEHTHAHKLMCLWRVWHCFDVEKVNNARMQLRLFGTFNTIAHRRIYKARPKLCSRIEFAQTTIYLTVLGVCGRKNWINYDEMSYHSNNNNTNIAAAEIRSDTLRFTLVENPIKPTSSSLPITCQ